MLLDKGEVEDGDEGRKASKRYWLDEEAGEVTQKRLGDIVINCSAGTQLVLKRFSFTVPYG